MFYCIASRYTKATLRLMHGDTIHRLKQAIEQLFRLLIKYFDALFDAEMLRRLSSWNMMNSFWYMARQWWRCHVLIFKLHNVLFFRRCEMISAQGFLQVLAELHQGRINVGHLLKSSLLNLKLVWNRATNISDWIRLTSSSLWVSCVRQDGHGTGTLLVCVVSPSVRIWLPRSCAFSTSSWFFLSSNSVKRAVLLSRKALWLINCRFSLFWSSNLRPRGILTSWKRRSVLKMMIKRRKSEQRGLCVYVRGGGERWESIFHFYLKALVPKFACSPSR